MGKKIITILIAISIIINIFAVIFIYLNLQEMHAPDTTIKMSIVDINSEEATIETFMEVYNPNDFEIIMRNMKIVTTTEDGEIVSRTISEGGVIPPNKNKNFSDVQTFPNLQKAMTYIDEKYDELYTSNFLYLLLVWW